MITAAQLRAARGLLDWTRADLAKAANISPETVKNIEHGTFRPQENTAEAIVQAFRTRHVEFTETGVKLVDDAVTIIDGPTAYLRLMQLAEDLMKSNPGEVLFMFANNKISPPEVVEVQTRLRDIGCKFRFIIEEQDDFMRYPKEEYRKIPKGFFNHDVVTVFADRVATLIDGGKQILVVRNTSLAETQRKVFDFVWHHTKAVS